MRRRVVITGVGAVTPLGLTVPETWKACLDGTAGIHRIKAFDASGFPVQIGAEVPATTEDLIAEISNRKFSKYADRKLSFGFKAAREAMVQADLNGAVSDPYRFGISMGTEAGRPKLQDMAQLFYKHQDALKKGTDTSNNELLTGVSPIDFLRTVPHLMGTLLAIEYGARGPSYTVSTACTASLGAIGEGYLAIRRDRADVMIVGGTDALIEAFMVTGFSLLGALSTRNDEPERASRPFDRDRDGFVLGEGAGFLVLEELSHAERRGAVILGEVAGYGCSQNAYRITDSPPDGEGPAQSMKLAMEDAGVALEEVSYINAHGTSTPMNDPSETRGIKAAFGDYAYKVPTSSTKSMTGHLVAACGAVETAISLCALQDSILPPTINQENSDPECDLDYVPNIPRVSDGKIALVNSFGFGGTNGTIVIRKFD